MLRFSERLKRLQTFADAKRPNCMSRRVLCLRAPRDEDGVARQPAWLVVTGVNPECQECITCTDPDLDVSPQMEIGVIGSLRDQKRGLAASAPIGGHDFAAADGPDRCFRAHLSPAWEPFSFEEGLKTRVGARRVFCCPVRLRQLRPCGAIWGPR